MLEISARWRISWQLDSNLTDPKLIKELKQIPERVLKVESMPLDAPYSTFAPSFLKNCGELHEVLNFNGLTVAGHGADAGAAVRAVCPNLVGNLKLVCTADAWLPNRVAWCRNLMNVRELHLLPSFPSDNDVNALNAIAQLPCLQKLKVYATSSEVWRAVCNLLLLEELHITFLPDEHIGELYKLHRLTQLRMKVLSFGSASQQEARDKHLQEFLEGLSGNMLQLKSLQLWKMSH